MNKLTKINKVDISLKQLSDIDTQNGSYDRVDNIRNGQILTAYVNPERTDQFRFRYLTDILVAGAGITFTTTNGITTISSTGGGGASPLTTKGDLYTRNASADTRLPVGTNGQILYADSTTATGLKWDTAPTGGGGLEYGIAAGTNTYTVTIAGVTGYVDGDTYAIKFTNGNDADSTININGLGAVTMVKQSTIQVTGGDIKAGQELILIYDGTNFQCIGVAPNQLFAFVTNDDSVTITKGQPVYAFGAAGNRMSVKLALNTSDATSAQTVGLVFSTSIAPNQRGFIITQGVISGINTAAYSPGNTLYLGSTAGSLTATKPFAPNHLVYIGVVERANAGNGQIYVKPQNGYEMNEIHDVQSNAAVNNDILYRDTTVSPNLWKPASISTILGYTPVPSTRTLTINGTAYDLSADRSWTIAAGGSSATIGATIDGSGGTITIGQKGYIQIPYACTINSWRLIANASGSIVVDVWKAAAPTIPTVANVITASAKPTLTAPQQTSASSTLTGWTTSVAANDIIGFNVNSATTVSWVILQLLVTKI